MLETNIISNLVRQPSGNASKKSLAYFSARQWPSRRSAASLDFGFGLAQLIHLLVPALPVKTPIRFVLFAKAIVIGLLACFLPARRAARFDPVRVAGGMRRQPHDPQCKVAEPSLAPQHFLNFLPLPQGHGSLRPIFSPPPMTRPKICCRPKLKSSPANPPGRPARLSIQ